jgi:hypothetical protein
MLRRHAGFIVLAGPIAIILTLGLRGSSAQGPNFDKLDDADRKVLAERFKQEVWPLLMRGTGEQSCVGCHKSKGGNVLKLSGDPDKDFRMLLRNGFFLKDDGGSLLGRIEDTNPKRIMPPPGKAPTWSESDRRSLRELVDAIDQKQKR